MILRIICLAAIFLQVLPPAPAVCAAMESIADEGAVVRFDSPLRSEAREVLKVYPAVRAELMKDLGRETFFRPAIVLVKDRASFREAAGSDLVTAFAVPSRDLIVIDYSRMGRHPYSVEVTLKHELCHLELHHQIGGGRLPRWLDEGICQWVTGGFGELIDGDNRSLLTEAVLSGSVMSIGRLTASFPSGGRDMLLAYEESRSIVEYIEKNFGVSALREVLVKMGSGEELDAAVLNSLHITLDDLEKRWKASLSPKNAWLYFIRDNLYEILFLFAALISVCGFFRALKKRRDYKDEEEEEEENPPPPLQ